MDEKNQTYDEQENRQDLKLENEKGENSEIQFDELLMMVQ